MSAPVTFSRACEVCAGPLVQLRSHARFCSNACRQEAYRRRKRGTIPTESVRGLTFETRQLLRAVVDRHQRDEMTRRRAEDRLLFAGAV